MSLRFMQALASGSLPAAAKRVSFTLPSEVNVPKQILNYRTKQIQRDSSLTQWLLRSMVDIETNQMVGHIGFHTKPNPKYLADIDLDGIEFGFTVFTPFRRQGYATEAAKAIMKWGYDEHQIKRFILSISPDNLPSMATAKAMGFEKVSSHVDAKDGPEDILQLEINHE
ncbi:MAG: GNAT family N-acetyltransferase [Chloroflexota bacterium]